MILCVLCVHPSIHNHLSCCNQWTYGHTIWSEYPPHGQWPAPMGSWRVINAGLFFPVHAICLNLDHLYNNHLVCEVCLRRVTSSICTGFVQSFIMEIMWYDIYLGIRGSSTVIIGHRCEATSRPKSTLCIIRSNI